MRRHSATPLFYLKNTIEKVQGMRPYTPLELAKAYLRHLIISNEMLGAQIASQHNLAFYLWLVKTAREKINAGQFKSWKTEMVQQLKIRL